MPSSVRQHGRGRGRGWVVESDRFMVLGGSSHLVGYNPISKWTNPTYPIYNWGYNPLTKWDEPPSIGL